MTNVAGIVRQLKKEHARALNEVRGIAAAIAAFGAAYGKTAKRRKLSAAARLRIAAAQKARWAKVRKNRSQKQNVVKMPKKRTISAAGRAKIAAAQEARWAKVKAAAKNSA